MLRSSGSRQLAIPRYVWRFRPPYACPSMEGCSNISSLIKSNFSNVFVEIEAIILQKFDFIQIRRFPKILIKTIQNSQTCTIKTIQNGSSKGTKSSKKSSKIQEKMRKALWTSPRYRQRNGDCARCSSTFWRCRMNGSWIPLGTGPWAKLRIGKKNRGRQQGRKWSRKQDEQYASWSRDLSVQKCIQIIMFIPNLYGYTQMHIDKERGIGKHQIHPNTPNTSKY